MKPITGCDIIVDNGTSGTGSHCGAIREYSPTLGLWIWLRERAWTGGDVPAKGWINQPGKQRGLTRILWRRQVAHSGGLDYWPGTSVLERARIFWNRAKLDAHRTLNP